MTITFKTIEELTISEEHKKHVLKGLKSGEITDAESLLRYLGLTHYDYYELVDKSVIKVYNDSDELIYKII
jgi:hypothetical protein